MKRFIKSFGYAYIGFKHALRTELNLRIHCFAVIVVILLGYFLKVNRSEWLILISMFGFVIVSELINTAIELLTNIVTPHFSEQAGKVKDIAASAVLLAAIVAIIIGCIIFYPHLQSLFYPVNAS